MKKVRLALLGCGFLNNVVAYALENGMLPEYELVGAMSRNPQRTKAFAERYNCKACNTIDELLALKPDFTSEAASGTAIIQHAEQVLKSGSNLVVLSVGALADADLYERIKNTASENNTKVYIASGTVGGFDILRATTLMGSAEASITSYRSPRSISYTPFYRDGLANITEPERVYTGTTKEAIALLPGQVNVAVATALACVGPENTTMNIDAVPGFKGDMFRTEIIGKVAHAELNIYSSSYELAGWSVVAALQNAVSPIVF